MKESTTNILSSGDNYPGIKCMQGATLTINSPGALTANGGSYGAGIGGGYTNTGGDITINGGTINANGASAGAGIGGGRKGSGVTIIIMGERLRPRWYSQKLTELRRTCGYR